MTNEIIMYNYEAQMELYQHCLFWLLAALVVIAIISVRYYFAYRAEEREDRLYEKRQDRYRYLERQKARHDIEEAYDLINRS